MARAFFQRICRNYRPYELIILICWCVFLLITLIFYNTIPSSLSILLKSISIIMFLFFAFYMIKKLPPFYRYLCTIVLVIFSIMTFFWHLDIIVHVNPYKGEKILITADRFMLNGRDIWTIFEYIYHPLFTEYLQIVYSLFYYLPLPLAFYLFFKKKYPSLEVLITGMVLAFFSSYLLYFTLPATSPYIFAQTEEGRQMVNFGKELKGIYFTERIRNWIDKSEPFKEDCFPSGHTQVTVVLILLSFVLKKTFFWIYVPVGLSLILSTMYLRYHYLIDVIVGIIGAIVITEITFYIHSRREFTKLKE